MANQLDRLLEGVTDNATIHGSVARLMRNIAAEAEQAGTAINPAASTALGQSLLTHAEHLASHVLANTPVIAATPPVHAAPKHPHDHGHEHEHGHDDGYPAATPDISADAPPDHRTKRQIAADERKAEAEAETEQPVEDHRTKRQIAADERKAAAGE
jgi:hypothetical protein